MRQNVGFPMAPVFLLLGFVSTARADTVRLRPDRTIQNVRIERRGESVRILRDNGWIDVPSSDVIEIISKPLVADELAERKRAAGEDPVALEALARWCAENGLTKERNDLLALARGIELDRALGRLKGSRDPEDFLALARGMNARGHTRAEREYVLREAVARDRDNAEAHRELREVRRDGSWVAETTAIMLDAEAEERAMMARGLVRFDGQWLTSEGVRRVEAERALASERALVAARVERLRLEADASLAAQRQRQLEADTRRRADQQAFIVTGPSYTRPAIVRRHAVHYAWQAPHAVAPPPIRHHEPAREHHETRTVRHVEHHSAPVGHSQQLGGTQRGANHRRGGHR